MFVVAAEIFTFHSFISLSHASDCDFHSKKKEKIVTNFINYHIYKCWDRVSDHKFTKECMKYKAQTYFNYEVFQTTLTERGWVMSTMGLGQNA